MSERPGMMIYFSVWESLTETDDATVAAFLRAAIQYSRYGVVPSFTGIKAVLWASIKDGLDRDATAYEKRRVDAMYAAYKRDAENPLSKDEWRKQILSQDERVLSGDIGRYHSISTDVSGNHTHTQTDTYTQSHSELDTSLIPIFRQEAQQDRGAGEGETAEQRFDRMRQAAKAMLGSL